jgi:hypothetical protein
MNQRWKLLSIGSIVLALLSLSENVLACQCAGPPPPCEAYWQAEAVFIGTPKELSWLEYEDKLPDKANSSRASRKANGCAAN